MKSEINHIKIKMILLDIILFVVLLYEMEYKNSVSRWLVLPGFICLGMKTEKYIWAFYFKRNLRDRVASVLLVAMITGAIGYLIIFKIGNYFVIIPFLL